MMRRLALLTIPALLLGAYLIGCDSSDNPIAPTGSTLTISASPTTIALSGQDATISITGFRPDGNPLNPGTQLTMTTTLGVLMDSARTTTNIVEVGESGRATAFLRGDGRQGTATVTVSLTNGGDGASATSDVQIGLATGDRPTVTVDANPVEVDVNETSVITVTARRSDGTPLTSGNVSIRTNLGTLSFDGNSGSSLSVPLTGGSNTVAVNLRSSQAGSATVTASIGASDEVSTTVEIGTSTVGQPTVSIGANPTEIPLSGTSTITITARQPNGAVLQGGSVLVRTTLGSLSQTALSTGANGTAIVTLNGGSQTGTATITASVDSSAEVETTVTIGSGDNLRTTVTLNANPSLVDIGDTSLITVIARDSNGNLLEGTATAVLTADRGSLSSAGDPFDGGNLTITNGTGEVTFTAEGPAGTGRVTGFVQNSEDATIDITIRDIPENVTLNATPTNIDGGSDAEVITLTATVVNADGLVLNEEPVDFSVAANDGGTVSAVFSEVTAFTGNDGIATVTLTVNTNISTSTRFTVSADVRNNKSDSVEITVGGGGGN